MKCYYFDEQGYMLSNTTTPDGYQVNVDGQWVKDSTIVSISAQGQNSVLPANFDYTPYLLTDHAAVSTKEQESTPAAADNGVTEAQVSAFKRDLKSALSQMGYQYTFNVASDGDTDITLWSSSFDQDNADVAKAVSSIRRTWNRSMKPPFARMSAALSQAHAAYGMEGSCTVNLVTADTGNTLLSYENGECLYDYMSD